MKILTSDIKVGRYTFKGVVGVEIQSSWEALTDTCTITLPRKTSFQGRDIATGENPLFRRGDKVVVKLGWDGDNKLEFVGYIQTIQIATPITIVCEDSAFLLKRSPKTISLENPTLKELLSSILPSSIKYEALDMQLGAFRIKNATPAKVLDELRKSFGLFSFFIDEVLHVGFPYPPNTPNNQWKFEFQRNIISDNLKFFNKEDLAIKIKGVSMLPNNEKIEVEAGDPAGELRTFHYYNLQKKELEQVVQEDLKRFKYTGWTGDFLTFGQPFVRHGDTVKLEDKLLDRRGSFLVKKVVVAFGDGGFRRTIYLDRTA